MIIEKNNDLTIMTMQHIILKQSFVLRHPVRLHNKVLIIGQPFPQQGLINQIVKLTPGRAMESVR